MKCERCQAEITPDEAHEHAGQVLCDDCYMDALSPARTCDPWATYTASRLGEQTLNPTQEKIMATIEEKRRATPEDLIQATGLDWPELERELAALRHMELVRATPVPGGGKLFCRFDDRD